jgi:signal transduction histidine kinase
MLLLSRPNAIYISMMAAASSVILLLLRIVLTGIDPESGRVYALSALTFVIALTNTLWSQALTQEVEVVVMSLLLVGTGFVFLSNGWFTAVLAVSLLSWLVVSGLVHAPEVLFFPSIGLFGAAALATMMHVVRRRTNLRAERLRRATEQQQEALAQALMVKEHQQRELEKSEESLQDALSDLQQTKKALEHRERELSRTVDELTVAKEKAEEASQLKSAMLANMSHEVRTPLTSISGFAEVLTEEASGQVEQFASMIHDNSKRLLDTLSSVLRLSKLEAGKQNLHLEPMDLVDEAEAIITEQAERAENAGVDLCLDVCEQCPCELDPGAVQRILRNLVGNAIKFTDEGGEVVVRVNRVTRPSDADLDEDSFTHAQLEVEDTGPGMSESFQENMFEAFRQESEDPRRTHEGSGLGLSITKELVDLLHGDISVESEVGVGTCFTIHLPRHPDETDADKSWSAAASQTNGRDETMEAPERAESQAEE